MDHTNEAAVMKMLKANGGRKRIPSFGLGRLTRDRIIVMMNAEKLGVSPTELAVVEKYYILTRKECS